MVCMKLLDKPFIDFTKENEFVTQAEFEELRNDLDELTGFIIYPQQRSLLCGN